ncbi:MAG: hypothetical protein HQK66_08985 [Desulfamplus sp.]|nr:hypothetical protein [Desulfamplus sp.]
MHKTTTRFWNCFERLPTYIQKQAKENFKLLKDNPKHPSLHFKNVGKFWSARASLDYRALAFKDEGDFIWVWIGTHDEYKRMIK